MMVLEEVITAYNDTSHQGLDSLSPNEYERRLMCVVCSVRLTITNLTLTKMSPFSKPL